MPPTTDQVISQAKPMTTDQAMQPPAQQPEYGYQDHMNEVAATAAHINSGKPVSADDAARVYETGNPFEYGSLERRDYYELGIGKPGFSTTSPDLASEASNLNSLFKGMPEHTPGTDTMGNPLPTKDDALMDALEKDTINGNRVDKRFTNFPRAPKAVAKSPRQMITSQTYPQVPPAKL